VRQRSAMPPEWGSDVLANSTRLGSGVLGLSPPVHRSDSVGEPGKGLIPMYQPGNGNQPHSSARTEGWASVRE
jgi:hypothetical protein